jgi:hypothetical protein
VEERYFCAENHVCLIFAFIAVFTLTTQALADGIWFDMADPDCKIIWRSSKDIDYKNCKKWRYVAEIETNNTYSRLVTKNGTTCVVVIRGAGQRISVEPDGPSGKIEECKSFTLQRNYK